MKLEKRFLSKIELLIILRRKSINFIGVKKERGEKQKPHFYDPENLTLILFIYNQVEQTQF